MNSGAFAFSSRLFSPVQIVIQAVNSSPDDVGPSSIPCFCTGIEFMENNLIHTHSDHGIHWEFGVPPWFLSDRHSITPSV